jgi:hypothetical protein
MQKTSLIFFLSILFLGTVVPRAQTANPFLSLPHDSVVIYDFEWNRYGDETSIINKNGRLIKYKKSANLDKKSDKKLSTVLGEMRSYGGNMAACFEPHLGIVYYKGGLPAAYITICIECNRLYSSVRIAAQEQGRNETETGEVYYLGMGMSKSLRKHLDGLLKKHAFSHRPKDIKFGS